MSLVKRAGLATAAAVLLSHASTALALFDVQVLVGKRWYEVDDGDNDAYGVQSQEVDVAAHLSPIPLVPVAFGAGVKLGELRKDDLGGADEAAVFEAGLEVYAWLPIDIIGKPYARLNYPLVGNMVIKSKDTETDPTTGVSAEVEYAAKHEISGPHLNVGLRLEPLPVVKFLVETGIGMQKSKIEEFKVAGTKQDVDDADEVDLASKTFMVGIEIGL